MQPFYFRGCCMTDIDNMIGRYAEKFDRLETGQNELKQDIKEFRADIKDNISQVTGSIRDLMDDRCETLNRRVGRVESAIGWGIGGVIAAIAAKIWAMMGG